MNCAKEVGQRLKQARTNAGFTQREVAEKLGMAQQHYARYEMGIVELNYEKIIFLCKLFQTSADFLFDLEEQFYRKS